MFLNWGERSPRGKKSPKENVETRARKYSDLTKEKKLKSEKAH